MTSQCFCEYSSTVHVPGRPAGLILGITSSPKGHGYDHGFLLNLRSYGISATGKTCLVLASDLILLWVR